MFTVTGTAGARILAAARGSHVSWPGERLSTVDADTHALGTRGGGGQVCDFLFHREGNELCLVVGRALHAPTPGAQQSELQPHMGSAALQPARHPLIKVTLVYRPGWAVDQPVQGEVGCVKRALATWVQAQLDW